MNLRPPPHRHQRANPLFGARTARISRLVRSTRVSTAGATPTACRTSKSLLARIVSACDAFHAMIEARPYRPALSEERDRRLRRCSGTQFDPAVVEALIEVQAGPSSSSLRR